MNDIRQEMIRVLISPSVPQPTTVRQPPNAYQQKLVVNTHDDDSANCGETALC